jgi:pimeloyl-ACP methyl ester carboxylesterase
MGFNKAILFGSSSGGTFAYQFAHDFPEMVVHLICHEAGLAMLLPDATQITEWMYGLLHTFETEGQEAAAEEFAKCLIGYDAEGIPKPASPEASNPKNFWEYEWAPLIGYCPNMFRIKEHGVSVGVMRGVRCKDAFYARAAEEQAKILECPKMTVPGHHEGFQCETEEFVPSLLEMLDILEKRK